MWTVGSAGSGAVHPRCTSSLATVPGWRPGNTVGRVSEVPSSCDVLVVGGGLSGLACARRLQSAGPALRTVLLEAEDAVGGRVRTDVVDGFRLDRGFQLINPAYPEVGRVLDVGRLRLQPLPASLVVATGDRRLAVGDPFRGGPARLPGSARALLSGALGGPAELLAFARWARRAATAPVADLLAAPDGGWIEGLAAAGVDGPLARRVVTPFLAGTLGERDGETSRRFVELLVRSFVRGRPSVPWRGMQAIPDQLAASLTEIYPGVPVTTVRAGLAGTADAGEITARAIVVAADPPTAAELLGLPRPAMRGLTTFWHVADEPPSASGALHVDGDGRGPVVNTVVMSHSAPGYAPDHRALIASTVLGAADVGTEPAVLAHLRTIYGRPVDGWRLLRRHTIPRALTAMPPPLDARRTVDLGDGLFVAGDHRDTASIQGALVSGRRAADAVLARLSG